MKPFLQNELDLRSIFARGRRVNHTAETVVIEREQSRLYAHLITSGVVRTSLLTESGSERTLYYGGAGALFGETACFGDASDLPAGARTVALTEVEMLRMPLDEFRRLCEARPDIVLGLLKWTTSKATVLVQQLESATFHDTTTQVAALLHAFWTEVHRAGAPEAHRHLLDMTHQSVASATGRSRVSVTSALNELREAGVVELQRGRVVVIEPATLSLIGQFGLKRAAVTTGAAVAAVPGHSRSSALSNI